MENRFAFKDLVLVLLLAAILAVQVLKMVQDDRQWDQFGQIRQEITNQTKDLTALRNMLSQGVAVRGSDDRPTPTGGDIFRRLKEARKAPNYAQGDWFIDNFDTIPPKLNEFTSQDIYSRVIHSRVHESLADYDIGTLQIVPVLAESWEMAADGLSCVFKLRRNVTFSNGDAFTADDVVFSYETRMNDEISDGRDREYYRHITKVEKIDDHTVKVHFAKVFYENFLRTVGMQIHSRKFFARFSPREIREHPALVMGTGPYRLKDPLQYKPGEEIMLLRNERYWGVPGPWDRMVFKIIEKESTEEIAFRNRELDMFAPTPEQHMKMLEDKALVDSTQHHVYEHIRTGYSYIAWNQQRGGTPTIFADKRVRQAMTMLIDRERLVKEIWFGFGRVASGPFSHLGKQYEPGIQPWPYDPERAVKLLLSLNFTRDKDGRMLKPDGKPFEIELTYGAGSDLLHKIALFMKDNLAKAGIDLKLNPLKWPLMLEKLNQKDFDAITLSWGAGGLESDVEQMFHSRTIKDGDNRNSYSNPALDKLIDQAHVTLDEEQRMKLWREVHSILHEDQPYTFMIRSMVRIWIDKRIQNVQRVPVMGLNYIQTWATPIEWFVPKDMQKHRE